MPDPGLETNCIFSRDGAIKILPSVYYNGLLTAILPPVTSIHFAHRLQSNSPGKRQHGGEWSLTFHIQPEGVTFPRIARVGDLTLIIPGILPSDGVDGEGAVVWGQLHPLCEQQPLAIEEPAYGDPSVICAAGQDHGILMFCDCGVAGFDGGLCHWVCGETEG